MAKHIQPHNTLPAHSGTRIGVVGLGYVGLPLAVEFSKHFNTWGYDIDVERVNQINLGYDHTREVDSVQLQGSALQVTSNLQDISSCNVFIITVPTPVDSHRNPDLTLVENATKDIAQLLKIGDLVVYESTVYPGCTEEFCVPILEELSGLRLNDDFFCGYSPERINPGDKKHTLPEIVKVVSGSTPEVCDFIGAFYSRIIIAGVFKTKSIRVAEAAKAIENAQRDINIAFVNELAILFNKLGIDTLEVLEAAGTKWNFLPFRPGFVGGHCIGVDPYYLTYKAQSIGYHPEVILAGRRINDGMGRYVAQQVVKLLISRGFKVKGSRILVLGLTFKENCPDIRNSQVFSLIEELAGFHCEVVVYDPWVEPADTDQNTIFKLITNLQCTENIEFEAVIGAVAHSAFSDVNPRDYVRRNGVVFDVKGMFGLESVDVRL
ncbi:nucleotide sugar dehydrogenase [Desulfurispira natronophila]|uniref:UDP-N-acetyl-D-galactosamine dehydrogenase n=1 Tax=Desulfurispira natronophila TaxID=682562 RepID=A0A7W8DH31_9BACT|nr:nucleotide sugar dehydrogenase [Desulfurispira natronophila]MBB5021962.1 UDP-N-acetyl-D-galactosamine dehydrogenase [Desulfurispira natronophila]